MRHVWLAALAGAMLLACQEATAPDPLAQAARDCGAEAGEAAIAACTSLIEAPTLEPAQRAAAYVGRAQARRAAGEVTLALRDFEAALREDEQSIAALIGRGEILFESGQLDAARLMAERAAANDPSGRADALLGRIALAQGEYDAALAHLDAALGHDDRLALAHAGRARARQAKGDRAGARADFSAAIRIDPALAEARAGRCWLSLEANENLDQARDDAEAAALADPRHVEGQICRGILQLRAGEPADALTSFAAALAVEPGNPLALFGHGVARMRTGDSQGSRDMNRARDFSEHVAQRYIQLGVRTR